MNDSDVQAANLTPRYAPRIAPTPIPSVGAFDEPVRCVAVNVEWCAHILGLLEALNQADTWIGTEQEIENARIQAEELLIAFSTGGQCMNCDCPPTLAEIQDIVNRNSATVQRNAAVWNGNAGSIHSYAGEIANFDTGGFGSNKSQQNCSASCAWVRGTVWHEYLLILTLFYTAAAAGAVAWLAGPLGLVLGAAAVLIAGMSGAKVQAALNDEAALDSIGCQLATLLAGDLATAANFITAVGSLTSATDNEHVIVQICKASAGSSGFYFYLSLWGEANRLTGSAGMILPCCCDEPCEFTVDLRTGFPAAWELSVGVWTFGQGIVGQPEDTWAYRSRIYVRLDEPCLPSQINVQGYHAGTIAHDLHYGFGDVQEDGSIVWRQITQWQGSSGEATYNHAIVPAGGTEPFTALYLETNDDTLVRFEIVEFVA